MSTQVTVGDFQVTSNAPAAEVVESLTSDNPEAPKPVVTSDEGKPVPAPDAEAVKVSEAAATLGKKGAEAAAKAKAEAAKEAKAEAKAEEKPKETPEPAKEAKDEEAEEQKSRAAERVKEATRQAAELKRQVAQERQERERLAREVAELRRAHQEATQRAQPAPQAQPQRQAPVSPDNDPQPRQEDFEDYAEYVDARARHAARAEYRERERTESARRVAHAYAETIGGVVNKFHERLEKAGNGDREAFLGSISPVVAGLRPSFLLGDGETPTTHTVIADEIVDSEHSAGLMKHFTDHPDDFQRIASLRTPRDIAREMAKLEAKLESATAGNSLPARQPASKPATSQAPPPVQPVTGSPHVAEGTGYRDGMSLDEYAKSWKPPKR